MGVSKVLSAATAILFSFGVFAQESYWYFGVGTGSNLDNSGKGVGLYFDGTSNPPTVTERPNMIFYESASTVTNCEGELEFYTDGIRIADQTGVFMPNGSGLNAGSDNGGNTGSAVNGVLSINDPSDENRYYVFTTGDVDNGGLDGLNYSVVDMSLPGNGTVDNPLGDVVPGSKNTLAYNQTSEMLAATGNTCGDTIWVVAHTYLLDTLLAYPVTENGVGSAVKTAIGPSLGGNSGSRGSADFNPQGDKLCMGFLWPGGAHIFDFNKSTGVFNNHVQVNGSGAYGCEWSHDGLKAYFNNHSGGTITQYNTTNSTSTIVTSAGGVLGEMERAPDGKIYIGQSNGMTFISSIDDPDAVDGPTAGFTLNSIDFGIAVYFGLPQQYIIPPHFNLEAEISSPYNLDTICDKGGLMQFEASPGCGTWYGLGATVVSDSGSFDPSSLLPGTYTVAYGDVCLDDDTFDIVVEDCCPSINVRDTSLCEGEDIFHVGDLIEDGIGFWSLASSPSGNGTVAIFSDSTFNASNYIENSVYVTDGNYELNYTYWNAPLPECPDSAVAIIEVDSFPRRPIGVLSVQTCEPTYVINAKANLEYDWRLPLTGSSNSQSVTSNGTYLVTVNSPGENCFTSDSVEVEFDVTPSAEIEVRDTLVCGAGEIKIGVNQSGLDYTWAGGGTVDGDSLLIELAGQYTVEIKSGPNGFCSTYDTVDVTLAPPFEVLFEGIGEDTTMCPTLDSLILRTNDVPGGTFNWNGGEDFEVEDTSRLVFGFNDGDIISLIVTDALGCTGDTSVTLSAYCDISDPLIPNIIVPNGTTNNVFIPIDFPPGTEAVYNALFPISNLTIFDRWGLKMFESSGYPNWNGTNKRDGNVPAGVYYWILELKDANGLEKNLNGFVEVIR